VSMSVFVGGFIRRSVVGKKAFIRVRDSTGVIQVVVDASRLGEKLVDELKDIGLRSQCISVWCSKRV